MENDLNKSLEYSTGATKSSGGALKDIQQEFNEWLGANTAVIAVRYASDNQIDVVLKKEKYTTVDNVTQIAFTIASWYAARSRQNETTCAVFKESGELYSAASYKKENK